MFPKYPKLNIYVGMEMNDYICTKIGVSHYNNNIQHEWKCKECGHIKVDSYHNIKRSSTHNFLTCKKEFFDKHYKGLVVGDYRLMEYIKDEHMVRMKCIHCGHERIDTSGNLSDKLRHNSKYSCKVDFCRVKRQSLLHNDNMDIVSTFRGEKSRIVHWKCKACGSEGISSDSTFKRLQHGVACTKGYLNMYKCTTDELRFMKGSWSSICGRCGIHPVYIGIENQYEDFTFFVKDILPKVQSYKARHNIEDIMKDGSYSIDRIDPTKHYNPDNTRIASAKLQSINTKRSHNKIKVIDTVNNIVYVSNSTPDMAVLMQVAVGTIGNVLRGDSKSCYSRDGIRRFLAYDVTQEEYDNLLKDDNIIKIIYEE